MLNGTLLSEDESQRGKGNEPKFTLKFVGITCADQFLAVRGSTTNKVVTSKDLTYSDSRNENSSWWQTTAWMVQRKTTGTSSPSLSEPKELTLLKNWLKGLIVGTKKREQTTGSCYRGCTEWNLPHVSQNTVSRPDSWVMPNMPPTHFWKTGLAGEQDCGLCKLAKLF